jgi:hypothetical protein
MTPRTPYYEKELSKETGKYIRRFTLFESKKAALTMVLASDGTWANDKGRIVFFDIERRKEGELNTWGIVIGPVFLLFGWFSDSRQPGVD